MYRYRLKNYMKGGSNNTKEIYFIRHGETEWNKLGMSQGSEADIELNETGRKQALLTGKYLNKFRNNTPFDCILSSPMKRAYETCEIIAEQIGFTGNIQQLGILRETGKGKFSGLKKDDPLKIKVKEKVAEIYDKIKDPIKIYEFDMEKYLNDELDLGMETYEEIMNRSKEIVKIIENLDCEKILIVSHSGILMAIIKSMLNLNWTPFGDMSGGDNCWISYIKYMDGKYKLISPPDTQHLKLFK
jgi:broad specificity phosphatase PhoE